MTDITPPAGNNVTPQAGGNDTEVTSKLSEASPEDKDKVIRELRNENAKWRKQFGELKTEAEKAEQTRLQQAGEWKTLAERAQVEAEQLKPFRDRATAYEQLIRADLDARIGQLPEPMRALVPDYDDLAKKQQWLNANWSLLTRQTAPPLDAGQQGNGSTNAVIPSEVLNIFKMAGGKNPKPPA